jgi:hypothetical protein
VRREASGRGIGIYTEWAEDGSLLRFADWADGAPDGADVRWRDGERLVVSKP